MKSLLQGTLAVLVIGMIAASAQAADHRCVIIIADPAHGVALIPDGTPIPTGIKVYAPEGRGEAKVADATGGETAAAPGTKALVFAHAPESAFATARNAIAAAEARAMEAQLFVTHDRTALTPVPHAAGRMLQTDGKKLVIAPNDSDVTYYVYFYDGSYLSSRRYVRDDGPPYGITYGVATAVYTPAGDYTTGTLLASQYSAALPGYNVSSNSYINGAGGYCSTPIYAYETTDPSFTAHVTSSGSIGHHYPPICGRYGQPPCSEHFDGTIEVYFP
jgi:hypothetical protein